MFRPCKYYVATALCAFALFAAAPTSSALPHSEKSLSVFEKAQRRWPDSLCITTANVTSLPAALKPQLKSLRLTGKISTDRNGDFRQIRDLCPQLELLDLSQADCSTIPDNALLAHPALRIVILPNNTERIGRLAFFNCRKLQRIALPHSTTAIGDGAFNGCTALKHWEWTPPSGLKVGFSAFEGVPNTQLPASTSTLWDNARRETYAIIPYPAQLIAQEGASLRVNALRTIVAPPALSNEVAHAQRIFHTRSGAKLTWRTPKHDNTSRAATKAGTTVQLLLDSSVENAEGYTLSIDAQGIILKGRTAAGIYYGLTTLEQLLIARPSALAPVSIADAPRTRVRELMVDPARTFIPLAQLKTMVTEMARYKFNALHLHLVDDQAWRIEIKRYPRLVQESSTRPAMDDMLYASPGYYTQEEMRELVKFAAQHHVMVIPEIELPGHEVAAIHAYPQLTVGQKIVPLRTTSGVSNTLLNPASEFTYEFLFNVFDELATIFPSPYVHLGGDEAGNPPLDDWTNDSSCIALKAKLGITTRDRSENWRLQQYMFDRVIAHLRDKLGKTPMFWYETDFKKIQPGCITFAWRHGLTKKAIEAARANNAKIMLCPGEHCYLDYPMAKGDLPEVNWGMPTTTLQRVYQLDPAWGEDAAFERDFLFGVTGTLWSECMPRPERIFYQAFPRALALAEVGWTPQTRRDYTHFLRRLSLIQADQLRRGIPSSAAFAEYGGTP